ncbi:MAG: PP2C family protein-serine/threonine phosphatase, partial [Armatimonadota bacterium]
TRSGVATDEDLWETMIVPLKASTDSARVIDKRSDSLSSQAAEPDATGYLMVARRRQASQVFTDTDRAMLEALGSTVDVAVTNVRALEAVRETIQVRTELARERRVAQVLTEGLLPDIPAQVGRWEFAKRYEAQSDESLVGGDIYDLFPLEAGRIGLVIADVSGKGLAAAKKTAMVKYSLRSYAREHPSPGKVLARLNSALFDEENMTGFVTLLYGVLEEHTGMFQYASAGHETPILMRSDGTFELLEPTGLVLGAAPDQEYDTESVALHAGDGLLLFTDGLTEARSHLTGELLEIPGVQQILKEHHQQPGHTAVPDVIWAAVSDYTGGKMRDDAAILWLKCGSSPEPERA